MIDQHIPEITQAVQHYRPYHVPDETQEYGIKRPPNQRPKKVQMFFRSPSTDQHDHIEVVHDQKGEEIRNVHARFRVIADDPDSMCPDVARELRKDVLVTLWDLGYSLEKECSKEVRQIKEKTNVSGIFSE